MRRADRLMNIVQFLRRRHRAVTASCIAEAFGICTRTVYRDLRDLMDSGVPISGEAGVGYVLDKNYFMPPVTFDYDELEAIVLGINMVSQWTDDCFAAKAKNALEKIQAVLPSGTLGHLDQLATYSVPNCARVPWDVSFSDLRAAIRARYRIHIHYTDNSGQTSFRSVRPLALFLFSPVWLLTGWCELREGFRNFRLDRIQALEISKTVFEPESGKDLQAYLLNEGIC